MAFLVTIRHRLPQWSWCDRPAPVLNIPGSTATGIRTDLVMHGEPDFGRRRHTTARTGRHPAITSIVTTGITGGAAGIVMNGIGTAVTIGATSTAGAMDTATDIMTDLPATNTRA